MKLKIEFGQTASRRLREAIGKARRLPGFTLREGQRGPVVCVSTEVPFGTPALWARIEGLLRIVGSWKSSTLSIDGKKIQPCWQAAWELSEVVSCYSAKQVTGRDQEYCLGRNTPSSDITAIGCRHLKGIDLRDYGAHGARWYEFGLLSDDQRRFTVDKNAIETHLRNENKARLCTSCPAFSWRQVRAALDILPAEIDLAKSDRFAVKFSKLDFAKPIGIERKERDLGFSVRFGFGEKAAGELPSQTPKRPVPKVSYKDVAGQDHALQQLRDVCELPLKYADYFSALGVTPHRGVILYGPPGNGKTLLAKAIAAESNAHLELINGPEILSKWVGQSEANLRGAFERARALAPSIVVIDELDAIASVRADMAHHHEITLISQLLVCLDGLTDRENVFVIGTTNRLDAVDSALKRPGRFDYHIHVPLPSAVGRRAILQVHISELTRGQQLDVADVAASTSGWSGAELRALVTEAGLLAIKHAIQSQIEPNATVLTRTELSAAVASLSAKRSEQCCSHDRFLLGK